MRDMWYNEESRESSQYLLEDKGKPRKTVSRWPAAGTDGCVPASKEKSGTRKRKSHKVSLKRPPNNYEKDEFIPHRQHVLKPIFFSNVTSCEEYSVI